MEQLVSSQTVSAKSVCFQGRRVEDVREDVRFAASSWKTCLQEEKKFINSVSFASSVFHKTTARGSGLEQLANVFPENTWQSPADAAVSGGMRVECGVSRAQAGWGQGFCQHHGNCPRVPTSSVDRLPAPRRARSTLLAGGEGSRGRLAEWSACRPASCTESRRVGASRAGAARAPAASTSAPACQAVFAGNFMEVPEQDLSPRTPWQCDTEGIRALAGRA